MADLFKERRLLLVLDITVSNGRPIFYHVLHGNRPEHNIIVAFENTGAWRLFFFCVGNFFLHEVS